MITFNTQEEFDAAVMEAVEKYLNMRIFLYEDCGFVKLQLNLNSSLTHTDFSEAEDYCIVNPRDE